MNIDPKTAFIQENKNGAIIVNILQYKKTTKLEKSNFHKSLLSINRNNKIIQDILILYRPRSCQNANSWILEINSKALFCQRIYAWHTCDIPVKLSSREAGKDDRWLLTFQQREININKDTISVYSLIIVDPTFCSSTEICWLGANWSRTTDKSIHLSWKAS